jgi:dTMP kinase
MEAHLKKGLLITLEGGEGSGKSTQIKLLERYLRRKGHRVLLTREPGGTRVSAAVRKVLLDNKNHQMTPLCETLLYMASRAQLVEEVIRPALRQGKIVLCDRWLDATVAYQGYAGGIDVAWIRDLGKIATRGIMPRLSIFLDLPLAVGLRRASQHKKADRMERKKLHFHRKVRNGYLAIERSESSRFRRIEVGSRDSIITVHEKIKRMVEDVLS